MYILACALYTPRSWAILWQRYITPALKIWQTAVSKEDLCGLRTRQFPALSLKAYLRKALGKICSPFKEPHQSELPGSSVTTSSFPLSPELEHKKISSICKNSGVTHHLAVFLDGIFKSLPLHMIFLPSAGMDFISLWFTHLSKKYCWTRWQTWNKVWKYSIFHTVWETISFKHAVSLKEGNGLVQSAQTSILVCILTCAKRFQNTESCHVQTNGEVQTKQASGDTAWEVI